MISGRMSLAGVAAVLSANAAEAAGLTRAQTVVTGMTGDLRVLVPAVAILGLMVLAVLWGFRVIRLATLVQFGGALVVAGSAAELVSMLFS